MVTDLYTLQDICFSVFTTLTMVPESYVRVDRGVGGPVVRGSGVGGLLKKNGRGRGSDGRGRGQKIWVLGGGTRKKSRGKRGAGVGRKNWAGVEELNPGGLESRPPCPPHSYRRGVLFPWYLRFVRQIRALVFSYGIDIWRRLGIIEPMSMVINAKVKIFVT